MAKKKSQKTFMVVAVAIALALYVLSVFIPRSPGSSEQVSDTPPTAGAVDAELQEALRMVESEQPMQGILKLREMADRDVHNVDAAWHLGRFSVETGQFENALKRLNQVVEHDHDGEFSPHVFLLLGHAQEQLGNVQEAKEDYTRFLESNTDPQLDQEVRERLKDLN